MFRKAKVDEEEIIYGLNEDMVLDKE